MRKCDFFTQCIKIYKTRSVALVKANVCIIEKMLVSARIESVCETIFPIFCAYLYNELFILKALDRLSE